MFTGLVEDVGNVVAIEKAGEGKRIQIKSAEVFKDAKSGDSISVSGACLTVEGIDEEKEEVEIFLAEETVEKTWFSQLAEGEKINLERSLRPQDRMGGHYVQGHVDATARIEEIEELEKGWNFRFDLPEKLESYIVEKGFIAIEGISLTVTGVEEGFFSVTIIPETWERTNLSSKSESDCVNLETDVMAKYVEKMV